MTITNTGVWWLLAFLIFVVVLGVTGARAEARLRDADTPVRPYDWETDGV